MARRHKNKLTKRTSHPAVYMARRHKNKHTKRTSHSAMYMARRHKNKLTNIHLIQLCTWHVVIKINLQNIRQRINIYIIRFTFTIMFFVNF